MVFRTTEVENNNTSVSLNEDKISSDQEIEFEKTSSAFRTSQERDEKNDSQRLSDWVTWFGKTIRIPEGHLTR